jgi:hypothetical protein
MIKPLVKIVISYYFILEETELAGDDQVSTNHLEYLAHCLSELSIEERGLFIQAVDEIAAEHEVRGFLDHAQSMRQIPVQLGWM